MSARLPLFVDLSGRRVLVVGGGRAAERKLPALLGAGALVTLIAPKVLEGVRRLMRTAPGGALLQRQADVRDVTAEYTLLFPLTDDPALNQRLSISARSAKVWVAGSTDPDGADFHLGAVVDRGSVRLAISTGGDSPALAGLAAQVLRQLLPESLEGDRATIRRERWRITRTLSGTASRRAALSQAVAALESNSHGNPQRVPTTKLAEGDRVELLYCSRMRPFSRAFPSRTAWSPMSPSPLPMKKAPES